MDFSKALTLMRQGRRVKTHNGEAVFYLSGKNKSKLFFSAPEARGCVTTMSVEYILADDWEEKE